MSIIPVTAFPRDLLSTLFLTGETSLIALQADTRFSYRAYIPDVHYPRNSTSKKKLPVLVAIHGTFRRPERYITAWKEFADTNGCIIVAPLFPASLQGPLDLDGYHYLGKPPLAESDRMKHLLQHIVHVDGLDEQLHQQNRAEIRHDLLLLSMLDEIALRWPAVDISKFYLSGFSGGAQFSHRFLYLHPDRLLGVCVGAPGSATHLDFAKEWPAGIKGLKSIFGRDAEIDLVKKVPILLFVGSNDVEGPASKARLLLKGKNFGSEEEVSKTRVEKTKILADNLRGAGLIVTSEIVEGPAHEMEECNLLAVDFVTRLMRNRQNE